MCSFDRSNRGVQSSCIHIHRQWRKHKQTAPDTHTQTQTSSDCRNESHGDKVNVNSTAKRWVRRARVHSEWSATNSDTQAPHHCQSISSDRDRAKAHWAAANVWERAWKTNGRNTEKRKNGNARASHLNWYEHTMVLVCMCVCFECVLYALHSNQPNTHMCNLLAELCTRVDSRRDSVCVPRIHLRWRASTHLARWQNSTTSATECDTRTAPSKYSTASTTKRNRNQTKTGIIEHAESVRVSATKIERHSSTVESKKSNRTE